MDHALPRPRLEPAAPRFGAALRHAIRALGLAAVARFARQRRHAAERARLQVLARLDPRVLDDIGAPPEAAAAARSRREREAFELGLMRHGIPARGPSW